MKRATLFEDFVVRCIRYAFAEMPAKIGRVFFSKPVALPFLRFRMLRHGYLRSPIRWHEISEVRIEKIPLSIATIIILQGTLKGLWISYDPSQKPDIVIYYAHGMLMLGQLQTLLTILLRGWLLNGLFLLLP